MVGCETVPRAFLCACNAGKTVAERGTATVSSLSSPRPFLRQQLWQQIRLRGITLFAHSHDIGCASLFTLQSYLPFPGQSPESGQSQGQPGQHLARRLFCHVQALIVPLILDKCLSLRPDNIMIACSDQQPCRGAAFLDDHPAAVLPLRPVGRSEHEREVPTVNVAAKTHPSIEGESLSLCSDSCSDNLVHSRRQRR